MEFERKLNARLILSIVSVGVLAFCGILLETSMNVAMPTLMSDFGITTSLAQWVTTGYLLVLAIVIPISSFMKKRFTIKKLFVMAIIAFLIGTILAIISPNFLVLLVGRLVQGIGTGIALPLMFNIVLEQAPLQKLGFIIGLATIIIACAPAVGPMFGGWAIHHFGWRMIFICLVPLLIIALIVGVIFIRQSGILEKVAFDTLGYILLALCFVCLLLGINFTGLYGWLSLPVVGLLILAVIFLILFIKKESLTEHPLISIGIFKYRCYSFSVLTAFFIQFAILGFGFLIPYFSQMILGVNAQTAGLILVPGFVFGIFMTPIGGKLYDRFGAKKIILPGPYFLLLACVLYALPLDAKNSIYLACMYIIFMFGQCLCLANSMANGLKSLPENLNADGNATYNAVQQLAGAIGTAIISSVVAKGQAKLPDDFMAGSLLGCQNAFWVMPIVMILVIVVSTIAVTAKNK